MCHMTKTTRNMLWKLWDFAKNIYITCSTYLPLWFWMQNEFIHIARTFKKNTFVPNVEIPNPKGSQVTLKFDARSIMSNIYHPVIHLLMSARFNSLWVATPPCTPSHVHWSLTHVHTWTTGIFPHGIYSGPHHIHTVGC